MLSCILIAFDERLPPAFTPGAHTIKPVIGPNSKSNPLHPTVCVLYFGGLACVRHLCTHKDVT